MVFLTVLFIYSFLTAIFLPIPVELALTSLLYDPQFLLASALVLGVGKTTGAAAIFVIGLKVEETIRYWSARHRIIGKAVGLLTRFVRVTGWIGLFILLSIPFMSDTVPVYLYSLFNKQGQLISGRIFLLVNFLAGILRAMLFVFIFRIGLASALI